VLYTFALTVPPDTPASQPLRQTATLSPGRIHRVFVMFPPNAAGLLQVGIEYRGSKIWPSNPDGWLLGDNMTWVWDEDMDLPPGDSSIVLVGFNLDDTYSHTAYFAFALLPPGRAGVLSRIAQALGVR